MNTSELEKYNKRGDSIIKGIKYLFKQQQQKRNR